MDDRKYTSSYASKCMLALTSWLKKIVAKKCGWLTIGILSIILAVYLLNYIGVGYIFMPSGGRPNDTGIFGTIRKSGKDILKDERRINLVLKVIDQFNQAVPNYKVAVSYEYVGWYHGILPAMAFYRQSRYEVKTDQNGKVILKPLFLRKGYDMHLEEIDRENYVFSFPKNMKFGNNAVDARGGTMLSRIDPEGKGQYVELRVLKHGPSAKLVKYKPDYGERNNGVMVEAKDENIFTVDIAKNKFYEGNADGDMSIVIRNARQICSLYREAADSKDGGFGKGELDQSKIWTVTIKSLKGPIIQQSDPEVPTFAPTKGYKSELFYKIAHRDLIASSVIERLGKDGWDTTYGSEIEEIMPVHENPNEVEYFMVGHNYFGRRFYLKNIDGKCYGYLRLSIDIDLWKDKILVKPECHYNPDGTNNLWTGD